MDRSAFEVHAALEQDHWWFQARRHILRTVGDRLLGADRGKTVLDIGCSVGNNLAAFHPDHRAIGFDPSPDAIEIGRGQHPGMDLRVGDFDAARDAARDADLVLLNDVIEHVPDDRALLAPLVAGLRPGSILLVTVPADMRLWSAHDEVLGHYRRYDAPMLTRAMAFERLEPLLLSHFNSRLYPVVRLARALGRRRRPTAESALDIKRTAAPLNAALRAIFAGEASRLLGILEGRATPYPNGVSLIAAYRTRA
jgi:SAM-dependent methyltransferase